MNCSDCNSVLCNNCYIQGISNDDVDGTFCYDCRKFGNYKNKKYYFGENKKMYCGSIDIENPIEQWMVASWYY